MKRLFYILLWVVIMVNSVWGSGNYVGALGDDGDSGENVSGDVIETGGIVNIVEGLPEIFIKAINPGYSVNGVANVGEMIEIGRNSDALVSLAGVTVGYTNSSGDSVLVEFPESSMLTGESILLRLASSPERELAAETYKVPGSSSGLAQGAGPLMLKRGEAILDSVCWTGTEGCYRKFKSGSGESLVRNLETREFEFVVGYEPVFDMKSYQISEGYGGGDDAENSEMMAQCRGLEFSEILSYYETSKEEQFIEIYNSSSNAITMNGCYVRYKNKNYALSGVLGDGKYYAYRPEGFSLTKNPSNTNKVELVDADGGVLDILEYYNGQKKGTSFAFIGYDASGRELWRTTFAPTPGEANNYQEFRSCEEGKVINEETGNCVKVTSVTEKVCPEGQYLNILTGRCKKYSTTMTSEKKCKDGYYLNPETNRCNKIRENTGADYSLTPETFEEKSSFIALYAVLGVVVIGLGYVVFEYRKEISKLFRGIFGRSS